MAAVTTLGALKDRLLGWTWAPAVCLARTAVLGILSGVEVGSLLITDEANGAKYAFGQVVFHREGDAAGAKDANTIPRVGILVKSESFWLRLLLLADVGFAESYMLGEFECNDLVSFFRVCNVQFHIYLLMRNITGQLILCYVASSSSL